MARNLSGRNAEKQGRTGRRTENIAFVPLNHEQEYIQTWLKRVRFKKAVIGGVSEADVWKKIAELHTLYEVTLSAERARYDALLAERIGSSEGRKSSAFAEYGKVGEEGYP